MAVYETLPSTNLRMEDVRDTLEAGGANFSTNSAADNYRNKLSSFFKSYANINKNSLYKPIRHYKTFDLTEQDYFNNDFGYIIVRYSNYSSLKTAISNNETWAYILPDGTSSEPYRIGDFRKYQYRASSPFEIGLEGTSFRIRQNVNLSFPTSLTWLTNWSQWDEYQGASMQYLNAGIYVPSVGYFPFTDTNQGMSLGDLDMDNLNFPLSAAYFSAGKTYSVYLILTTFDGKSGARTWYNPSDTDGGDWWFFPQETVKKFTVLKELTPLDYVVFYITGASCSLRYAGATMDPIFSNVKFTCEVGFKSDYTGASTVISVTFEVSGVYSGSGTTTTTKTIGTIRTSSIGGGQTYSQYISYSNDLRFLTDREHLAVTAKITLASGYSKNVGFTIEPS